MIQGFTHFLLKSFIFILTLMNFLFFFVHFPVHRLARLWELMLGSITLFHFYFWRTPSVVVCWEDYSLDFPKCRNFSVCQVLSWEYASHSILFEEDSFSPLVFFLWRTPQFVVKWQTMQLIGKWWFQQFKSSQNSLWNQRKTSKFLWKLQSPLVI